MSFPEGKRENITSDSLIIFLWNFLVNQSMSFFHQNVKKAGLDPLDRLTISS